MCVLEVRFGWRFSWWIWPIWSCRWWCWSCLSQFSNYIRVSDFILWINANNSIDITRYINHTSNNHSCSTANLYFKQSEFNPVNIVTSIHRKTEEMHIFQFTIALVRWPEAHMRISKKWNIVEHHNTWYGNWQKMNNECNRRAWKRRSATAA